MTDSSSWLDARLLAFEPEVQRGLTRLVRQWFAPEDDALMYVRQHTADEGMPEIQIRPEEGRMLQFLAGLIGARRILEIGTLAGYSGIWLARGLPPGGQLTTLEMDPKHARVAQEHFQRAGVADRVQIVQGDAHATLARWNGVEVFDMVFLDAEKEGYPAYLEWAVNHVRPGGLITAHNAFREGKLLDEDGDGRVDATRQMLEAMARHPRLRSTIVPVGDGIAAAQVTG